ncbi:T9SS type A sorting domain-containing protein [candidate division WOR-3 bacterium]|nr:T9SS type A sorting domain-containing protein [candidate division WOR-3 bacterium]
MRGFFVIILGSFMTSQALLAQDNTIIDTVYSSPEFDGEVYYKSVDDSFKVNTQYIDINVGDAWIPFPEDCQEVWIRGYISFGLSSLPETIVIVRAVVGVYQWKCGGNNIEGLFPIWDVPGGDTLFCLLDHIDYGNSLDTTDWTAGDEGDPRTLTSNIGVISNDSVIEWKTMDVTQYIQADIDFGRGKSQFRIRFPVDCDYDFLSDRLIFYSGDTSYMGSHHDKPPYLAIEYKLAGIEETNPHYKIKPQLRQNTPNPFSKVTAISYSLPVSSRINLKIYDLSGMEVITLINKKQKEGDYVTIWDRKNRCGNSIVSGVYFCQLVGEDFRITRKMVILR